MPALRVTSRVINERKMDFIHALLIVGLVFLPMVLLMGGGR
jgi:hypothetical protein